MNVTYVCLQVEQAPSLSVLEAGRVTLTCAVLAGSPEPRLLWRRKDDGEVIGEGRRFVIETVQRTDGGTYICEADNGFGGDLPVSSVELLVYCKYIIICCLFSGKRLFITVPFLTAFMN
jgi:hypothetical protein